jgi:hypothetical protein
VLFKIRKGHDLSDYEDMKNNLGNLKISNPSPLQDP